MKIFSSAFPCGSTGPPKCTCGGENVSPPLAWSSVPSGTKSLALVVEDPGVPDPAAPKMTWEHWVLYNSRAPTDATAIQTVSTRRH